MEYPGAKITRGVRRTVLAFFVIFFFVISPIIILYTVGYRYDWKNGLLKETGAISIDVLPKNTAAYLNGLKLKEKMPIRLNNITPAKYSLRLSLPGYYDWQKEIEVKNKQTTYIKEFRLIKKDKAVLTAKGVYSDLTLSHNERYLAYKEIQNQNIKLWLIDLESKNKSLIYADKKDNDFDVVWGTKHLYLAILPKKTPYERALIINAESPDKIIDLVKETGEVVEKFQWRDSTDPEVFFGAGNFIKNFFPQTKQALVVANNKFIDWRMEGNNLWALQINTSTKKLTVLKDVLGFKSEMASLDSDSTEPWKILFVHDNNVLLKKNSDQNITMIRPDKKFKFAGDKFLLSNYNNWWLIWTPWELWTYSEKEDPYLLIRSGEKLAQILPLDEFNTLALLWEKKLTVLFPYYFIEQTLLSGEISSIAADTENRILYYSDKDGIWKLSY